MSTADMPALTVDTAVEVFGCMISCAVAVMVKDCCWPLLTKPGTKVAPTVGVFQERAVGMLINPRDLHYQVIGWPAKPAKPMPSAVLISLDANQHISIITKFWITEIL